MLWQAAKLPASTCTRAAISTSGTSGYRQHSRKLRQPPRSRPSPVSLSHRNTASAHRCPRSPASTSPSHSRRSPPSPRVCAPPRPTATRAPSSAGANCEHSPRSRPAAGGRYRPSRNGTRSSAPTRQLAPSPLHWTSPTRPPARAPPPYAPNAATREPKTVATSPGPSASSCPAA